MFFEYLRTTTKSGDCDFLVASHYARPEIRVIANGVVSAPLSEGWIGNSHAMEFFRPKKLQEPMELPHYFSKMEASSTFGFLSAFSDRGTQVREGIGGAPTVLLGSPYGHCYSGYAFTTAWDTIDLAIASTPEQLEDRKTGKTEWRVHGCDPEWRGVAVYGIYLEQPSIGFLYDPLQLDTAEKHTGISYANFGKMIKERAGRIQGAFLDK